MKKTVVHKRRMTVDEKIDELARMMANGFDSLETKLRAEIHESSNNVIRTIHEEMNERFASVHRDILSIHDILTDHDLRITKLEGEY